MVDRQEGPGETPVAGATGPAPAAGPAAARARPEPGERAGRRGWDGQGGRPARTGRTNREDQASLEGRAGPEGREDGAAGEGRTGELAVLAGGLVAFGAALAAYVLMATAHPHDMWGMPDLRVYRWGGLLARHSHRLYDETIDGFGFTYPPMPAAVFAVLSEFSMRTLRVLSASSGLVSLLLSVGIAGRMLGHRRVPLLVGATFALSAAALWTEPVQKTLWFGQVNLLLMLIVLADLAQDDGRRWKGAGIGLATGIKLTPAIFIVYLVLTRRFRAAAVAGGMFLATVAAGFAALPHESVRYWLTGLFASPGRVGPVDGAGNQSLYGMLVRLFGSENAARPYWLAAAAATAALGLWLAARASRRGDELRAVVTCAVTGLLVSPVSWSHHWVWVAPALVLVADRTLRRIRRPARTVWPARGDGRPALPESAPGRLRERPGAARSRRGAPVVLRVRNPAGMRSAAGVWTAAGVAALVALEALFGAWIFAVHGLPALPEGLIRSVPFGLHREEHWHGAQLLVGNLYVLVALAVLLCLAAVAVRERRAGPAPEPAGGRPAR